VDRIARGVEYVGTLDTTIMGSRNGLTPLFLWYAFKTLGLDGYREMIQGCFKVADYAVDQLYRINRHAWRHKNSLTVVFDRPSPETVSKWQLASRATISHLIAMPHVTNKDIDELVVDLARDRFDARKNPLQQSTIRRSP
jgi:histidine decarboxylase